MSIRNRLVIAFLAILLIPASAIGYFSYQRASQEIQNQMQKSSQAAINSGTDQISELVAQGFADLDYLSANINSGMDTTKVKTVLDPFKAVKYSEEAVYYGNEQGMFAVSPNKQMAAGFDHTKRAWYMKAMEKKGQPVITDPAVSADGKNVLTAMIAKSSADGHGVVGANLDLSKLSKSVANVKVGDKGYVFLLDQNKKFLVHPTREIGSENKESYIQEIYSKDSGTVDFLLNGLPKRLYYVTNKETGWKVISTIEMTEVAAATQGILHTTIIVVVISVILGTLLALWIIRSINNPLRHLIEATDRISNGDLTKEIEVTSKDEIATLSKSMNNMVRKLRDLIGGVVASSQNVAAASEEISASTQEIASDSTIQAESAQNMQELFSELQVAISAVAESAESAAELASNTTTIALQGGSIVSGSIESMNQVSTQVSLLENDSNKIGEIIEVISDIADQTNLLALNAAIEAARAGEQGRGFAVVADEVRKLAERSADATKQITSIIKGMQVNTQQSVAAVSNGVLQSQETGKAFDQIVEMINQTESKVTEIAAACEEQSAQTGEVMHSIENISGASQSSAAASEETASTSQSLAQLAEELNHSISIFKVN